MKPKDYIAKYNISQGWRGGIQNRFVQDMAEELNAACEDFKADNLRAFTNALNIVRSKWESISKKIPYGIPESLWSFFYATVVCNKRQEVCPEDMKKIEEDKDKKKSNTELNKKMTKAKQAFFEFHKEDYKKSVWCDKPFEVYVRECIIKTATEDDLRFSSLLFSNIDKDSASYDEIDATYRDIIKEIDIDDSHSLERAYYAKMLIINK